jgi:DNA-binding transcriptional regulator LsrR (DeoR family)
MKEDLSQDRHRLLSEIADLYYNEGLSQQEIAKKINMSRPSISRLLLEARDSQIVEIKINHPISTVPSLEEELTNRFPLESAHILEPGISTDDDSFRNLGRLGAEVLHKTMQDGMILGLSWGTTVHVVIQELRPKRLPDVKVVQLIGGVGAPYRSIDGPEQVRHAGEMFGAQHYYLNAPMLVDSPDVAAALREDHSIKEVLELARETDVALIGIGSIIPEISTQYHSGYVTYENLRELSRAGAIGAICTSFFSLQGEYINTAWCDDCAISISWDELMRVPTLIGVARGIRKAPAILGAVRSGVVDILVTDDDTAQEMIRIDSEREGYDHDG